MFSEGIQTNMYNNAINDSRYNHPTLYISRVIGLFVGFDSPHSDLPVSSTAP